MKTENHSRIQNKVASLLFCLLSSFFTLQPAEAVELTIWEHEKEDVQKFMDDTTKEFMQAHPDIKIKRSHYKTEDLRTQYQTAAIGGGGPDLLIGPNDFGGPFSIMQIIQPIDWTDLKRFDPQVLSAITDKNGKVWGIPLTKGNHLMLFVNKKLIPKTPTTVEELIEAAKKINDPAKGRFGFAYNLTEPFWFVTFLGAYGGSPLTGDKPVLDSEEMVKALAFVKRLKFDDKIVPPDCDYVCAETLFIEQKAGMIINGDWAVQKYADALKDSLAIAPLPKMASTGKFMMPMVSGKYLYFNGKLKGEKLKAAKLYADYLVSPGVQERSVNVTMRLSSLKDLPMKGQTSKNTLITKTEEAIANGQAMPMAVEMRAVWDAIRPQLQEVMSGRKEPKVAATMMQKDADKKIMEMKQ